MKIKSGMFFVIFIWIWTDVLKLYTIRRRKRKEIFCLFGFLASRNITHYYNYYYYYSKSYTTIPQIRAEYYLVFWKKNCATNTNYEEKTQDNTTLDISCRSRDESVVMQVTNAHQNYTKYYNGHQRILKLSLPVCNIAT